MCLTSQKNALDLLYWNMMLTFEPEGILLWHEEILLQFLYSLVFIKKRLRITLLIVSRRSFQCSLQLSVINLERKRRFSLLQILARSLRYFSCSHRDRCLYAMCEYRCDSGLLVFGFAGASCCAKHLTLNVEILVIFSRKYAHFRDCKQSLKYVGEILIYYCFRREHST